MVSVCLPEKTTNQNVRFIFQHGGILDHHLQVNKTSFVGKWFKIVFYDERTTITVCMFSVWHFKLSLLTRVRLELTRRRCIKLESAN